MEDISVQENGLTNKQDSDISHLINSEENNIENVELKEKISVRRILNVSRPKVKVWKSFPCSTKTRQRRYVIGIVATSSLGSFLWGYSFSIMAGAMLLIEDHFNLNVLWHETIVSALVGGATVGAAIAGTLNDKFGRWKVMMLSAILHAIAAAVMALAFSAVVLVIGRTVAGLAIGIVYHWHDRYNLIYSKRSLLCMYRNLVF